MFERFTERSRRVVVRAQEASRLYNHANLDTEHLLLGLLLEHEGLAAQALAKQNVTEDKVQQQIKSLVGYGGRDEAGQEVVFSSHSRMVLEHSLREALGLGHNYIGTEHLLLGLLDVEDSAALNILSNIGVDLDQVRREVLQRLGLQRPPKREAQPETDIETRRGQTQMPPGFQLRNTLQSHDSFGRVAWSLDG